MPRDAKAEVQQTIGRPRQRMRKLARDDRKKQKKHHLHEQAKQSDNKQRGSDGSGGTPKAQTTTSKVKADSGGPSPVVSYQDAPRLSRDSIRVQKEPIPSSDQPSARRTHSSQDDGHKPTVSIIAGAVAAGVVLLLAVLGILLCKRRSGSRASDAAKAARRIDTVYTSRDKLTESPADSKFPTLTGGSPPQQQLSRYSIPECLENASRKEHVSVALPYDDSAGRAQQANDVEASTLSADRSVTAIASSERGDSGAARPSPGSNRGSSSQDGDTTLEGDERHIDRCLSYYMKRRTAATVPPEALPDLRSPVAHQQNFVATPTSSQTPERDVNFPKTVNLLGRIRRSQIRLNEEALSKAKDEGFRLPKRSHQDEPSEKILGTSPAISEPHNAFEYAEYYDSCLPSGHLSIVPQGLSADDPALRWQDHSPSRSSALSPRRSTTVSTRQRSATFSQASPVAWPCSPCVDDGTKVASRHRSKRRPDARISRRESARVDEVIRF